MSVAAILVFGLGPASAPPDPALERAALERALDLAVRQVSRPSPFHAFGAAASCRSYPLHGYGVVFVLPPRLLPAPRPTLFPDAAQLDRAIQSLEEVLKGVRSPEVRLHMEKRLVDLRRLRDSRRPEGHAAGPGSRGNPQLRALEEQAIAFEQQAARAQREAEAAMDALSRQIEEHLATATPKPPPVAHPSPADAPPAPPPWRFWVEPHEEPGSTTEGILREVRVAVTSVLETQGTGLRSLGSDAYVIVAVDFYPHGGFVLRERPERTLVLRVRKKEMDERRAGRLAPDEFRRRLEIQEY